MTSWIKASTISWSFEKYFVPKNKFLQRNLLLPVIFPPLKMILFIFCFKGSVTYWYCIKIPLLYRLFSLLLRCILFWSYERCGAYSENSFKALKLIISKRDRFKIAEVSGWSTSSRNPYSIRLSNIVTLISQIFCPLNWKQYFNTI